MSRILSLNLDFVLILQGGLLLLLASASRGLASDRKSTNQSWGWFGAYAVLQAIRTGLELSIHESGGKLLLTLLNDTVLLGSSLLLIEFARSGSPRPWGRWVHLPLIGGLTLAQLLFGPTGLAWTGFVVAILAGVWTSVAFWRWEGEPGTKNRPLRQAGLIIIACQLLAALPDEFLYGATPGLAMALPPIVVRCALVFMLTIVVLQNQISRENSLWSAAQIAALQRRRNLCGGVVILIGFAGWVSADLAGMNQDRSMRQQILARTQIAAAAVSPEDISQLYWDDRDLPNPAYMKLKALMIAMRRANSDLRFVLLAGMRKHQAYFLADSENPESKDYSPPGQSYDEAPAAYLAGLASGQPFVLGPETDRWGTWLFGDVPILDARGHPLAYLELDIAAADWDARICHARLPVLLITLLIVTLVLGSYRALEQLRESSAEIALSEQRNRSLVEGSPDCVQMFDHMGCYVAVNQNGLRALGLTEADVLGRHFSELWPEETRPKIVEAVRATITGQPNSFEADYKTPEGRTVTWRVATNPVYDTMGRVRSFVGICVDLTARKQAELAMLAAKKAAEDATQAKSDFLAVMSHEIRTPLSGVIGMLDLLQQCPLEPLPRRYTKFARDSADTLLHLLDDALDSAKMEAGKLSLETIPFRPHDHFESAFESASMRADTKGLVFRHEVAPSVPAVLLGDPTRLRQIISNLVNNALKFTEKGSVSVTVSAEPVGISAVILKIVVTDTGIGISEEARSRLFMKFAQAESSTTRHYGGTGLGLSIVKSLAELMGGEVSVTSTPGQGSSFIFTGGFRIGTETARPAPPPGPAASLSVPAPKLPVNPAPAPARPARPARPLRVLIVDDDVSNRTVAESLVNNLGHREVAFAVNGREAVDRLIAEKFDVVLMDNRMPLMDGFTATRLIRDPATGASDPGVYIIALTANASADDRAKCLAGGMNDFVTKPVRAPAMADAMGRAVDFVLKRSPVAPPAAVAPAQPPTPDSSPPGLSEAELLASLDADEAAAATSSTNETMDLSPEMLEKITAIFFRETPRRLESMRDAFTRRDAATLGLEAHTLKSNARYLNARHLSELCARLEKLSDHGQYAEIEPLLREAEQSYAALRDQQLHPLTT